MKTEDIQGKKRVPVTGQSRLTPIESRDIASITAAVRVALDQTGHSWLRQVTIAAIENQVVLGGLVPTFYLKQLALVAAMTVPGVGTIRNDICVRS